MRRRLTLGAALAVALTLALGAGVAYVLIAHQLRSTIDRSLSGSAAATREALVRAGTRPSRQRRREGSRRDLVVGLLGLPAGTRLPAPATTGAPGRTAAPPVGPGDTPLPEPRGRLGSAPGYLQVVTSAGLARRPPGASAALPVTGLTRAVAAGSHGPFFSDAHVAGVHLRIDTIALPRGRALQLARPVDETDRVLSNVRTILLLVGIGGVALAALLGLLLSRAVLDPVRRLTRAAEEVATTQRLDVRIDATGDDELSGLARSFNRMLDALQASVTALDQSLTAQRQLVADASHELRTPLTSLRTNIEVLQLAAQLPLDERARLLDEVRDQLEELTRLVADLIELGRGDEPDPRHEPVELDQVVAEAVARLRSRSPATELEVDLQPTVVSGVAERLARAVGNLLDNAVKHGGEAGRIEVRLADGELTVRDHGAGLDPADLPHVFDRFYRAASARGRPGSGLGLAIVRQVAEAHGGRASAANAAGGGGVLRLALPVLPAVDAGARAEGPPVPA